MSGLYVGPASAPTVRVLVASLILVLFAGCVAEEEPTTDPLFAVCPQWISGPSVSGNATAGPDAVLALAPQLDNGTTALEHEGFPLDLYVLDISTTAPVTVRIQTSEGRALLMRDATEDRPDSRPSLVVDGEQAVSVYLTAIEHGTLANPSAIQVLAEGSGDVSIKGTAWYRVCGAVLE